MVFICRFIMISIKLIGYTLPQELRTQKTLHQWPTDDPPLAATGGPQVERSANSQWSTGGSPQPMVAHRWTTSYLPLDTSC